MAAASRGISSCPLQRRDEIGGFTKMKITASAPIPPPNPRWSRRAFFGWLFAGILGVGSGGAEIPASESRYETREQFDPQGINKFFMGRQIARVMGHQAADWLERPEREAEEKTETMVEALKLREGEIVADIGVGSGFIARKIAKQIGEKGVVYGVDIQPEMLEVLKKRMAMFRITNVRPVLGEEKDPKLPPESVDTMIMVDVYHEFEYPHEMIAAMIKALKPGGRIVFVEFRGEDPSVPIKAVHKMTEQQIKKEMSAHPLEHVETIGVLPWQHIVIFRKTAEQTKGAAARDPNCVQAPSRAALLRGAAAK
jgi:tRNA A58 N-methylase Trm61